LQGVQGTQGIQGEQGIQGLDGAFAAQGVQGAAGPGNIIDATDDSSTAVLFPVMVGAAGSSETPKVSTSKFVFNASEGDLKTKFRGYSENVISQTVSSGSYTANLSLTNIFDLTLQSNVTITFSDAPPSGTAIPVTLILRQPSTDGNTVTYSNTVYWSNAEEPVLSSGIAGKLDVITLYSVDGGSIFYGGHALANVG
jgi:hypothetical protein